MGVGAYSTFGSVRELRGCSECLRRVARLERLDRSKWFESMIRMLAVYAGDSDAAIGAITGNLGFYG
jgi:hypothetical protein